MHMREMDAKTLIFSCLSLIALVSGEGTEQSVTSATDFTSWTTSDLTIPTANRYQWTLYDDSSRFPDCIWLLGGNRDEASIYCYNITVFDSIYLYDTFDANIEGYNNVHKSAVLISNSVSDYIYFIRQDGVLVEYDIVAQSATVFEDSNEVLDFSNPCMEKHPFSNQWLFVVDLTEVFWIYDFETGFWTQGPSLNYGRTYPACIANRYDNSPYLYVLGGNSEYVEKIDLDNFGLDGPGWIVVGGAGTKVLDNIVSASINYDIAEYFSVVSYGRYIYLIGGFDSNYEDDVVYLDVSKNETLWDHDFIDSLYGAGATVANDRVYLFGGYDGSYLSSIIYSNILPPVPTASYNATKYQFTYNVNEPNGTTFTVYDSTSTYYEYWTLLNTTMPEANARQFLAYDEDSRYPECVWLLAGQRCSSLCVYCFNLTTQEFIEWDTLNLDGDYSFVDTASVLFSEDDADYIYLAQRNGDILSYNINIKNATTWYDYSQPLSFEDQCLAKHPQSNQWLFVVDLTENFWIYDFKTGFWTQGPDLNYGRTYAQCIVHQYNNSDPYLYVIGGNSEYVEKINLNNFTLYGAGWETVGGSAVKVLDGLSGASVNYDTAEYFGVFTYDKYIYLIGGYDSNYDDDVVWIDTQTETAGWDHDFKLAHYGSKAIYANDRIYLFGGYNGAYWNYLWYTNEFPVPTVTNDAINASKYNFVADPWTDGYTYTVHDSDFFETWTLSDTTLPAANARQFLAYDADSRYPECAWLLAGQQCSSTCVYCFNFTSQTFIEWDTLNLDGDYSFVDTASVLFSEDDADYIYFAQRNGDILRYDIDGKNATTWYDYSQPLSFEDQCLGKHPFSNQWLFVVDLTENFWIYDFETGFWTQGPDLNYGRTYAQCIVHVNEGEDPYLYVIGGNSEYVEKINLNNFTLYGAGWETVGGTGVKVLDGLSGASVNYDTAEYFGVFTYDKYIFLVGGYDSNYDDDVVWINTRAETAGWDSDFPLVHYGSKGIYYNDRVWIFGGYDGSYWNYMWYSSIMAPENNTITVNESKYNFVADPWADGYTYTVHDSQFFDTWTLSDTALPAANARQLKAYEADSRYPECIWLLAGQQCSSTCVYCFNLTTQEFVEWDTLNLDGDYTFVDGAAVLYSRDDADYIYFAQRNGYIIEYNIDAKNASLWYSSSKVLGFEDQCLTRHPQSNQWLFVVDLTENFWIYDFKTGFWTQGPDLNYGRTYAACIVHQQSYDDPYLYVVGGNSEDVERINLNAFTLADAGWESFGGTDLLDGLSGASVNYDTAEYFALFTYDRYIFIVAGYDSNYDDDVSVIDTATQTAFFDSDFTLAHYGSKAVFVNNRVWVFGGYDGSYWNYMWYSNLLPDENITLNVNASQYDFVAAGDADGLTFTVYDSDSSYFETWTVSDEVLPVGNYWGYVVHDENSRYPECIWIVGGIRCDTCVYCYNLTSQSIVDYDTLTSLTTGYSRVSQSAALISNATSDYIYFVNGNDGIVYVYDIVSKTDSVFESMIPFNNPCLTMYDVADDETMMFIVNLDETFYYYSFKYGNWTAGPSLSFGRTYTTCVINDFDSNNPNLYTLGGNNDEIEKINLRTVRSETSWKLVNASLDDSVGASINYDTAEYMEVISYGRYIFLIAGYDSNYENSITYLNVVTETFRYDSDFILPVYGLRGALAAFASDGLTRVFIFGGYDGSNWDCIIYSNALPNVNHTNPPSPIPTVQPTNFPTEPTETPTYLPTLQPSDPTSSPSNLPTAAPFTKSPTTLPTTLPTSMPSTPTAVPTIPTVTPTDMPAQATTTGETTSVQTTGDTTAAQTTTVTTTIVTDGVNTTIDTGGVSSTIGSTVAGTETTGGGEVITSTTSAPTEMVISSSSSSSVSSTSADTTEDGNIKTTDDGGNTSTNNNTTFGLIGITQTGFWIVLICIIVLCCCCWIALFAWVQKRKKDDKERDDKLEQLQLVTVSGQASDSTGDTNGPGTNTGNPGENRAPKTTTQLARLASASASGINTPEPELPPDMAHQTDFAMPGQQQVPVGVGVGVTVTPGAAGDDQVLGMLATPQGPGISGTGNSNDTLAEGTGQDGDDDEYGDEMYGAGDADIDATKGAITEGNSGIAGDTAGGISAGEDLDRETPAGHSGHDMDGYDL